MKKAKSTSDELRAGYKRSDFKKLERGKYYQRIKASTNVVVTDPDVLDVFPNSAAVNRTLRALVPRSSAATSFHIKTERRVIPRMRDRRRRPSARGVLVYAGRHGMIYKE